MRQLHGSCDRWRVLRGLLVSCGGALFDSPPSFRVPVTRLNKRPLLKLTVVAQTKMISTVAWIL
jgi:hypothetical protein